MAAGFVVNGQNVSPDFSGPEPVFRPAPVPGPDGPTPEQRVMIWEQINRNREMLQSEGLLPAADGTLQVLFNLPLRLKSGLSDPGFFTITGYVDNDTTYPNHLLDYHCGQLTYDTQNGYNHRGTDFYLWPYPWLKMDSGYVEVVAAAPGVVLYKNDGEYDHSCTTNNNLWNAVYIQHSDGSIAWYGHMKNGSLTSKGVGQSVNAGEYLGIAGSSGNSTGPHLHFEVYDASQRLIDPFYGSCNIFNNSSWWNNQLPYLEKGINRLATGYAPPEIPACPAQEIPHEKGAFSPLDTIYLDIHFRNLNTNDLVNITIRRPNNSVWNTWSWNSPWPFYVAAYAYWWMVAGTGEPTGQWTFEADYNGKTYTRHFTINPLVGITDISENPDWRIYPNPASASARIVLDHPATAPVFLTLTDLEGNTIATGRLSGGEQQFLFPLDGFASGYYLVRFQSADRTSIRPLIVR